MTTAPAPSRNAAEVRERLEQALRFNLVGPGGDGPLSAEELPGWIRPSNWYLTGFLVPRGAPPEQRSDGDAEDDSGGEVPESAGLAEESAEDLKAAKRGFFPSSIGLSFLVGAEAETLTATVRWGEYAKGEAAEARDRDGKPFPVWRRTARSEVVPLPVGGQSGIRTVEVPASGGLRLHVVQRSLSGGAFAGRIPPGALAVSVFLVNERPPPKGSKHAGTEDAFQTEIEIRCDAGFVGRPDPRGFRSNDWDGEVADLHYADTPEYATGHGVSADWKIADDGVCRRVRTTWIPRAEVEKIETVAVLGAELSMRALGETADGTRAERMLRPLVTEYRGWIESQRAAARDLDETRPDDG